MINDETNFLTEYSQFLDDSGKHLTYAALSIYRNFSDELSQKEKIFLKNHIDSCSNCSARLQEVTDVEEITVRQQPKTVLNISPIVFRYAIAAILVAGVGLTIFFVLMKPASDGLITQHSETPQIIAETVQHPERFVPNQMLENFVERRIRSSSGITLITPAIGDTLVFPFTFQWNREKSGTMYTIVIVDNKNMVRIKETTSSSEITIHTKLSSGLYYVKLEANDELVQMGKFLIIR